jgi:anti-anti-sigma factor
VTVEERASSVLVHIDGDIDLASVRKVTAALNRLDLDSIAVLVVDLEQVGFLGLTGLNAIFRLGDECENNNVQLSVVTPRGPAKRIFMLTGAHLQLDLVDPAVASGR